MKSHSLLSLLHLCDSLFPIGGFGYSDGLESATSRGIVTTPDDLARWLDTCLDEIIGRADGPTLLGAWTAFRARDWEALARLDREATALRPSSATRRSSRAMGLRLMTTWQTLYPDEGVERVLALAACDTVGPALPIAFACASASAGIGRREAAAGFCYTRLAATISSAMRLMRLGQTDAHRLLARSLDRVPAAIDLMIARATIESFAPAMDIAMMTQQYLHSRLFRS